MAVDGDASITLGALTLASASTVAVRGAAAVTLGTATSAAAGGVLAAGTASVTLGAATLTSAGKVDPIGTLAVTLGALVVASAGTVANAPVVGTASITLGALELYATNVPFVPSRERTARVPSWPRALVAEVAARENVVPAQPRAIDAIQPDRSIDLPRASRITRAA